jgi:hypothetical protein
MWRLVREGFRFYRPVLLISCAFGAATFVLILVLLAILGSAQERGALPKVAVQVPLPILLASAIACFIALSTERSENRVRLHSTLPVSVRQVALARVLLPTALLLLGLVLAHVLFAIMLAIEGSPPFSPRHFTVDFIAVQLLFWVQVALAVREIIELRHRVSWSGALGSKVLLVVAVAVVALVQLGPIGSMGVKAALTAALDAAVMAFTIVQFERRTSFVR